MNVSINTKFMTVINWKQIEQQSMARCILDTIWQDTEDFTGWTHYAENMPDELLKDVEDTAKKIQGMCDTLVVIGIGGSYLGSAAILEALGGHKAGYPELVFAGTNLSGNAQSKILADLKDKEFCLCVVSKSGITMESMIAFSVYKEALQKKYGDKYAERIVAVTDPEKGLLREEANRGGYKTFEIPSNVGGRYSAYTPGIIFPLAVAGVDVRTFVEGAKSMADEKFWHGEGLDYALARYAMLESGKVLEVYEYFDPCLRLFGEWMKQLFAESEGKEGKGLFPVTLTLSTDLHSIGQYLQEGKPMFFETFIDVKEWKNDVKVPESIGNALGGMSMNEINAAAVEGVIAAHHKAGTPILRLTLDRLDEYTLGQLTYYCMMTAAITGKLMGVDPFNQPGVEQYKKEIKARLGL